MSRPSRSRMNFGRVFSPKSKSAARVASAEAHEKRRKTRVKKWRERFKRFSLSAWHESAIMQTVCGLFKSSAATARAVRAATSSQIVGMGVGNRSLRIEGLEARQMLSAVPFTSSYTQDFDTLEDDGAGDTAWTNDATLEAWSLFNKAPAAITLFSSDDGGGGTGRFYSYGTDNNSDRALGGVASGGPYFGSPATGTVAGWMAVALQNNTAGTIDSLDVHFDGEQWRRSGEDVAQTMTMQYGLGTSFTTVATWNNAGTAFDFASPNATGAAGALDGNAVGNRTANLGGTLTSLNWTAGSTLWVRWVDNNDSGSDHGLAIDNVSISLPNALPTAAIAPITGINEGDSATLDGSLSSDTDGTIVSYEWDLNGDLVYGDVTGASPVVSWATLVSFGINDGDANYTIGLRVTDDDLGTATTSAMLSVTNTAPSAMISGAPTGTAGVPYSLNISQVTDPGSDTLSTYWIFWGDGDSTQFIGANAATAGASAQVYQHTYATDGPYTIELDFQDEDAYYIGSSYGRLLNVTIDPAPPGAVTVNGTDGDDDKLVIDMSTPPGTYQHYVNNLPVGLPISLAGVVDLHFIGGAGANDVVEILDADGALHTYDYTNASDGTIDLGGLTIHYTGLEPISNTGTVADVVFNLPVGTDNATLSDIGGGMLRLAGSTFEDTDFLAPTNSLTINGEAIDTLLVTADITVTGSINLNVGTVSLNGDLDAPTITGTADVVNVQSNLAQIGDAIRISNAGATVTVGDGNYAESPSIDRSLTLKSANGRDATTIVLQSGPTYLGALTIAASSVAVQGFTIQGFDAVGLGLASTDILVNPNVNGISIADNRLQVGAPGPGSNGDDGMGVLTTFDLGNDVDSVSVTGNIFEPVGTSAGRAFYINPGVDQFLFQNNQIQGNFTGRAITQAKDATIDGNTVVGSGASAGLGTYGWPDATVYGHATFTNNSISGTATAISLFDSNSVTIENNFLNGNGTAVRLFDFASVTPGSIDPTTIEIHGNNLDSTGVAVVNDFAGFIDASGNWWGSNVGAIVATKASGDVDFSPYLDSGTDTSAAAGFQGSFATLRVAAGGSIQEALDAATMGGTVYVDAGTYTENVTVDDGKDLRGAFTLNGTLSVDDGTLKAGNSPGIIASGSMTLTGSSTLEVEVDGTTPGTGHSQYQVTGTVDLGGATLDLYGTYVGDFGDSLTIIDNDGTADPVTGQFAGLGEGAFVVLNGRSYEISYVGGDNNDVTLSIADEVWVDDDWVVTVDVGPVGLSAGDTVDSEPDTDLAENDTLVSNLVFGFNAFSTIADALAAVTAGGVINVLAGTYLQSFAAVAIDINKDVTIAGQSETTVNVNANGSFEGIRVNAGRTVGISGIAMSNYSTGVRVQGTLVLADSTIGTPASGGFVGVWVDGGSLDMDDTLVTGAQIFGVQVGGGSADIDGSEIVGVPGGTAAAAVVVSAGSATIDGSILTGSQRGLLVNAVGTATLHGSSIAGNGLTGVENATATAVDASGNWWGTDVESGPGSVQAETLGLVDFTPYLADDTDTDGGARGFAGDFSYLHVTSLGAQTGGDSRIQEAVDSIDDGALSGGARTVFVHNGLYTVENTNISQSLTVQGESRSGVVIAPDAEDSNNSGLFDGTAVHAFLVNADDVTITKLTIDGEANPLLTPGKNNFRTGVLINAQGSPYDDLTVDSVDVLNIYRRGIQISSSGTHTTGHQVTNSLIDDVELAGGGYGITVFEADALVAGNTVRNATLGIATNWINAAANAGVVTIQGNTIDNVGVGIYASGLAGGSLVGGPMLSDRNEIDLTQAGGSTFDLGIIVDYATGTVTVQNNEVLASAGDTAIWLYHNELVANPVEIFDNVLTATGSTRSAAGEGVGIFSTDNGVFNGDEDGDSYAVIRGNTITNFVGGIELDRSGTSPVGGRNVVTAIGGPNAADNNEITGIGAPGSFGILVFEIDGAANGGYKNVATIENNDTSIHGFDIGIDIDGGSATITGNHIYDNTTGIRFTNGGAGGVDDNDFEGDPNPDNGTDIQYTATAGAVASPLTGNTFAGTTYIDNQSPHDITALRVGSLNPADNNIYKQDDATIETNNFDIESRIFHELDNAASGLVTWVANTIFVTPAAVPTPTDNDYTRIKNAIEAVSDGWTIDLQGTFDWTESNAAASWALGNDGVVSVADDYAIIVPTGLDGVTFTASGGLGTATIDGPGDLAGVNLEGVLVFDGGDNQGWTISNMRFLDFDLSIAFFNGAGGSDAFNNTTITNNYIRVPADLNATDDPADVNQNIGIHYSFGTNQTISNNTIELDGSGLSDGLNYSSSVGMQSNTSGGAVYDGLLIDNNTINVTGALAVQPSAILGIWENAHGHSSDITVSNNKFFNLTGDNAAANLMRAFRVTSHSSGSTTVTYSGNTVDGANIGFQWYTPSDYSGNAAIELTGNTLTDVNTGFLVQSNGVANFSGNSLTNSGAMAGVGIGMDITAGSIVSVDGSPNENTITGFATGIRSAGTLTVEDNVVSIHGNVTGIDVIGGTATITGNHIYDNDIGIRFGTTGNGSVTNNNFDGPSPDNRIDLQLLSSAGAVTIGAGNKFAGDTLFIDNQSTQSYDLSSNGTTFDEANNFRIEDKMHHRMDTDLAVTVGLVTWVAGVFDNLYVTTPGVGSTDSSIQRGVDAASAGDTVNVEAGPYIENVAVGKRLTIDGAGSTATDTVVKSATIDVPIFTYSVGGLDATHRQVIKDIRIQDGLASTPGAQGGSGILYSTSSASGFFTLDNVVSTDNDGHGLVFNNSTNITDVVINDSVFSHNSNGVLIRGGGYLFDGLSITDSEFTGNDVIGFSFNPNQNSSLNGDNFSITNTTFTENGDLSYTQPGSPTPQLGRGDIGFQFYNGDATLTDVTVNGLATNGAHIGIQFRGDNVVASAGTISLNNVTVTGSYVRPLNHPTLGGGPGGGLFIQNYTDVSTFSFTDVDLLNTEGHQLFAAGLSNSLNLGDTEFGATVGPNSFHIALGTTTQNPTAGSPVNATGATFGGVPANTATTAQLYAIADKVLDGVDVGGVLGLVRLKTGHVYVTPNSFLAPATTTANIQRAVDLATSGDVVHIQGGGYTGSVSTAGKSLTLDLGASTAQVIINGDFTLDSDDTLSVEINGASPTFTPGTDYDQIAVNGLVSIGGAFLMIDPSSSINADFGESVRIIDNDLTDTVSGTFDGLPNGDTLTINSQLFQIFYDGGTGNDVVLVHIPAAPPPDVVFVDDSWSIHSNGTDADGPLGGTLGNGTAIGYDQFATIEDALAAVAGGATSQVLIYDGQYYTSGYNVNEDVSIQGESRTGVIVAPADEDSHEDDSFSGVSLQQAFIVSVSGVTISTLTIDGDGNNLLTGDNNFRSGIITPDNFVDLSDLLFTNLDVKNIYRRGIQVSWSGDNNEISDTLVEQDSGTLSNGGAAIGVFGGAVGATVATRILDNDITNVSQTGIVSNFGALLDIRGNTITATPVGMNLAALDDGSIIGAAGDGNIIDMTGAASDDIGIQVTFSGDSPFNPGTVTVEDNDFLASGGDTGIMVFRTGSDPLRIIGNTFSSTGSTSGSTGEGTAIFITDDDEFFGESSTDNDANVEIQGNTITDFHYGVHVRAVDDEGAAETLNVLIGGPNVADNNDISGTGAAGSTGILVEDNANPSNADVTIQNNNASISGFAVGIDVVGATVDISGNDIYDNGIGIRLNDADATLANNDVHDNDGTGIWVEGTTTFDMTGGTVDDNAFNGLFVNGDGTTQSVTVDGTSFSGNAAGQANLGDIVLFNFSAPVATPSTASFSNVTVTSNNSDFGIQIRGTAGTLPILDGSTTAEVTFNNVDILGTQTDQAMLIQQYADLIDFSFTDVVFDSVAAGGLIIYDAAGTLDLGNTTFHDNYTAGDGLGNGTGYDIATSLTDIDATDVTFLDSLDVALDKTNLEANFAIEDRVAHVIDADAPGPLVTGLIDWVDSGTYANAVFVTQESYVPPVLSTTPSIQRGIDAATAGDDVWVEGGAYTYTENLSIIGKDVNLRGETGNTPNLQPAAGGNLITIDGSGFGGDNSVVVDNFNLNGLAGLGDYGIGVSNTASLGNLTVSNSTFTGFDFNAIAVFGNATTGLSVLDVDLTNLSFSNNGLGGGGGAGDVQFFEYNGDATLTNLDLVGSATASTGARLGIQFRGTGNNTGVGVQAMGSVTLNDIDVSGDYRTQMIGFQRYTDANVTFTDVKLGGATSEITGTFGASLRFDAVGFGSIGAPETLSLGNTLFRGLDPLSAQRHEIEIAPDNLHTFLRLDGTSTQWDVGGIVTAGLLNVSIPADLAKAFAIEDRILHYVDKLNPTHALTFGPYKGFVDIVPGQAFIGDDVNAGVVGDGSIQRGVNIVASGGTVHVSNGSFIEDIIVNNEVTILSENGAAGTEITGVNTGFGGAVRFVAAGNGAQFGDVGRGFTVNGVGEAGVYLQSGTEDVSILHNIVKAATGKNALLTEGGVQDILIEGNTFDTISGSASQLVYVNGTTSVSVASTNVDFIGNVFAGDATGPLLGQEADDSEINGNNQFTGSSSYAALELWGDDNTISGNTLTGGTGIGILVNAPVTGALIDNDNDITGYAVGIQVDGSATITGNDASITGNAIGIQVTGSAIITGNNFDNTTADIDVNGGTALVEDNVFAGTIGVLIQNGGIADLGQNGPGTNFTGLGISTGGNDFSSYTVAATSTSGTIVNLNSNGLNANAGPQGVPPDVPAFNNAWNINTPAGIENVIWHDADDSSFGFVDYESLANLVVSLDPLPSNVDHEDVDEGGSVTVYGEFTNDAQAHTVTINWGDGSPDSVVNLGVGVFTFAISSPAGVTYTDDPNGPVQFILRNITVTVEEDANPLNFQTDTSLSVDVNNVIPDATLSTTDNDINEGQVFSLDISAAVDPGDDTILSYRINWGDGTNDVIPGNLTTAVNHTHTYQDGLANPNKTITLDLFDEDGTWNSVDSLAILVRNVDPTAGGFFSFDATVNEGSTTTVFFVGPFTDPGNPDTPFHYAYDFNGNGVYGEAGEVGDGTYSGSGAATSAVVPASFLADDDDSPRTVKARIIDNDGGYTEYMVSIGIDNVAPVVNAGADSMAFSGIPFNHMVSFTDPGADAPWTVNVDWNGDGDFLDSGEAAFNTNNHTFNISHTYGMADIGNTYNVKVQVDDNDGGVDIDIFQVTVVEDTFRVIDFQAFASGFDITFNRAPDLGDLNLYDGLDVAVDLPDLTVEGNVLGFIDGSIVWDAATNTLTWLKTGGVLAADTYTVTLVSDAVAFEDTLGNLLDGDGDFDDSEVNDDYVDSFTVNPSADRVVYIRDFARGAGQDVNVPNTGTHLPVFIDSGAGVTAVDVDILYDPTLLNITAATLGAGPLGAGGWLITTNFTNIDANHTLLEITVNGINALSGSNVELIKLNSDVPATALYGPSQVLRLQGLRVNEDLIASKADFALHKAIYVGDADGDGFYGGTDSALISRVVVNLDTGFDAHDWTDPVIAGDASGDGTLSGLDASYVAQEAVLIDVPEVPPIPGIPLVFGSPSIDPQYSIDANIEAQRGGSVIVPVELEVLPSDVDDGNVVGGTFVLKFDDNIATFQSAVQDAGWSILFVNEPEPGVVRAAYTTDDLQPAPLGQSVVANVEFSISDSVTSGTVSDLDIRAANPNEGGLVWTDVDGSLLITPAVDGDFNDDFNVNAADYVVWRKFQNTTVPNYTLGDGTGDGEVEEVDYDLWMEHYGEVAPGSGGSVANDRFAIAPSNSVSFASAVQSDSTDGATFEPSSSDLTPPTQSAHDEALAGLVSSSASTGVQPHRSLAPRSRFVNPLPAKIDTFLLDLAMEAKDDRSLDRETQIGADYNQDDVDSVDELFAAWEADELVGSVV